MISSEAVRECHCAETRFIQAARRSLYFKRMRLFRQDAQ